MSFDLNTKYVLVKVNADYSDEFDCECFWCGRQDEWEKLLRATKASFADWEKFNGIDNEDGEYGAEIELYFGTNEELRFSTFDDWQSQIQEVKVIEFGDHSALTNVFSDGSEDAFTFGTGDVFFDAAGWIAEAIKNDY